MCLNLEIFYYVERGSFKYKIANCIYIKRGRHIEYLHCHRIRINFVFLSDMDYRRRNNSTNMDKKMIKISFLHSVITLLWLV